MRVRFYLLMILGCIGTLGGGPFLQADTSMIVAGYFENYAQYRPISSNRNPFSLEMVEPDLLTDLYYAFAGLGYITPSIDPKNPRLTGDFTLQPIDSKDESQFYPQAYKLKAASKKGLRLFLSVGGWNFNNPEDPQGVGKRTYQLFSQMVAKPENRKQFIDSAVAYLHRFHFDGLDIDWEYPGDLGRGGSIDDFDHFITFLRECQTSFRAATPSLLLSYSAPAHMPEGLPKEYKEDPKKYFVWLAACSTYLDRLNVMGYDYHGPYNEPKITGVNAPLYRDTSPGSPYYIARTLDNYISNGVLPQKILLGLPAFGVSYAHVADLSDVSHGPGKPFEGPGEAGPATQQKGLLAYFEIADKMAEKKFSFGVDTITNTVYAFNLTSREWVSFDNPDTIKLKVALARAKGLQGVILWAIDLDEYQWNPTFPILRSASSQ